MARSIYCYTDSRAFGGAEQALLMLMAGFDRDRWDPALVLEDAPGAEQLADLTRDLGIPVRRTPPLPLGLRGARLAPGLARMLGREAPDVFHAHLSWPLAAKWGLAAAIGARVPAVVATVQLIPTMEITTPSLLQLRAIAAGVGRYIAVSRDVREELVSRFHWPAAKIEVIYNAVELERFRVKADPRLRAELSRDGSQTVVLTPARLHEQKGHGFLLRAAKDVPGAVFALAGDGPERAALEALADELGIADRVIFLGHREDVPQLLAASDVFALPSLYEGSSLAVLEAMAARVPVISSRIGGTDELIEDGGTGLLVGPGDVAGLGEALRGLVGSPSRRASLAAAAYTEIERDFSREAMTESVTRIYDEILGAEGAHGG